MPSTQSKSRGKAGEYRRVATIPKEEIELVDPLDYLLLDALPKVGTTLGGIVPLGETVRNLKATKFGVLTSDQIGGRLRAMEKYGFTKSVLLPSGGSGWQITPAGRKRVKAWKDGQSTNEEGDA